MVLPPFGEVLSKFSLNPDNHTGTPHIELFLVVSDKWIDVDAELKAFAFLIEFCEEEKEKPLKHKQQAKYKLVNEFEYSRTQEQEDVNDFYVELDYVDLPRKDSTEHCVFK